MTFIPYLPAPVPIEDGSGIVSRTWLGFFQALLGLAAPSIFTIDTVPPKGASDAGYQCYLSDYGHLIRWDGSAWHFAPGDVGNGFLLKFAVTPQEPYWGQCDGSTYAYLIVGGAALSTVDFTTASIAATYFRI